MTRPLSEIELVWLSADTSRIALIHSDFVPLITVADVQRHGLSKDAVHQCPWKIHNTRVGMNSGELHESIGMVLTDATSGHSKDIDQQARQYLDTHNMAGCFCNHSKDPNATISWTSVTAVDAPRCALVPTIVALRRIEAGEFVMLDYGIHYDMDNKGS